MSVEGLVIAMVALVLSVLFVTLLVWLRKLILRHVFGYSQELNKDGLDENYRLK